MSLIQEDVAIVRRGYRAFNDADLATLAELFDDNASWHTPGRSPVAGDAVGRNAVFARFGRYLQETGGTLRADLKRVLTDEDGKVIGIHHNVGERDGKELDVYCCIVFEVSGRPDHRRPRALLRPARVGRVLVVAAREALRRRRSASHSTHFRLRLLQRLEQPRPGHHAPAERRACLTGDGFLAQRFTCGPRELRDSGSQLRHGC